VAHLIVVRNEDLPSHADKLPLIEGESLLDVLLRNGIAIAHECGGTLACATCCVIVREGLETLTPASEDEQDMLERAGTFGAYARLACQAVAGSDDLVVEIPPHEARQVVMPIPATAASVTLSERAAQYFSIQLERYPGAALRLSVKAAGCAGFAYSVDHTVEVREDDTVFESRGIRIVVGRACLPHVQGTTLDLVQDGLARRLRFHNPNATETCGCGESFGT
jgi:iron-sulfur cluster assembly protein